MNIIKKQQAQYTQEIKMKPETAKQFLLLTEGKGRFTIEEQDDGLAVSWDLDDKEIASIIELEHPGIAPDLIESKFEDLMKEIIHVTIEHAKKTAAAASEPASDE
jgi:hypothetical protein